MYHVFKFKYHLKRRKDLCAKTVSCTIKALPKTEVFFFQTKIKSKVFVKITAEGEADGGGGCLKRSQIKAIKAIKQKNKHLIIRYVKLPACLPASIRHCSTLYHTMTH